LGLDPSKIVVRVGAGELLVLDAAEANRLGIPTVKTVAQLGEDLELNDWQAASDYGEKAMSGAKLQAEQGQASAQVRYEKKIADLQTKREQVAASIDSNVALAKQAVELGLEPMYPDGKLTYMRESMEQHLNDLARNRFRKGTRRLVGGWSVVGRGGASSTTAPTMGPLDGCRMWRGVDARCGRLLLCRRGRP